jgi:hypothetical protein
MNTNERIRAEERAEFGVVGAGVEVHQASGVEFLTGVAIIDRQLAAAAVLAIGVVALMAVLWRRNLPSVNVA